VYVADLCDTVYSEFGGCGCVTFLSHIHLSTCGCNLGGVSFATLYSEIQLFLNLRHR
jgi:hypothetical protein